MSDPEAVVPEKSSFEQFVDEFDMAVELTNEPEEELVAEPEPSLAEPTVEPAIEAAPVEPAEPAPIEPSPPPPDLRDELAKLREELASLRQPPPAPQPSYEEVRTKAYSELERSYSVPEKDLEDFITNPGPALAKMAANLHLRVIENVAQLVQQQMSQFPAMLEQQNAQRRQEEGFWGKFDGKWPGLRGADPSYREKVAVVGAAFRQINPKATEEEFIEKVGAQTSMLLGVVPPIPDSRAAQSSPPTKPPSRGGKPGGGKPKTGPWEELARDFLEDDNF